MKYFLKFFDHDPIEVSKQEYKLAESAAGYNQGDLNEPWTSCFHGKIYSGHVLDKDGNKPIHMQDWCALAPKEAKAP
jgi:hypothetical protein